MSILRLAWALALCTMLYCYIWKLLYVTCYQSLVIFHLLLVICLFFYLLIGREGRRKMENMICSPFFKPPTTLYMVELSKNEPITSKKICVFFVLKTVILYWKLNVQSISDSNWRACICNIIKQCITSKDFPWEYTFLSNSNQMIELQYRWYLYES